MFCSITLRFIFKVKHFLVMHLHNTNCAMTTDVSEEDLPRLLRPPTVELLLLMIYGMKNIQFKEDAGRWVCEHFTIK